MFALGFLLWPFCCSGASCIECSLQTRTPGLPAGPRSVGPTSSLPIHLCQQGRGHKKRKRLETSLHRSPQGKFIQKHTASEMLDALRASGYLRNQRCFAEAMRAFEKCMRSNTGQLKDAAGATTAPSATVPCRTLLLQARVRLDVVGMLLSRISFAKLRCSNTPMFLHLCADASPQWKGCELFGAWVDIQNPSTGSIVRRQLPLNTLGYKHMSVSDKLHSLLWMLVLEVVRCNVVSLVFSIFNIV